MTSKHVESVAPMSGTHPELAVHVKTIVVVLAMTFLSMAQIFCIIGSGLLSRTITRYVGHASLYVWLPTIINIGSAALNPMTSQAADLWGRKWILVGTTAFAMIGSIVISRARNIGAVFAGFCCLGIMFGGQAVSFAVAGEVLPRKHRALGQASINIGQAAAGVGATLFAGAVVNDGDVGNFRTYFYVATALFGLSTASILLFYNPPPRELQRTLTQREKFGQMDWIGILTFGCGIVLFCMALAWSENPFDWSDPHILATFILGAILLIGFCMYEVRFKKDGIAHHGLFKDKNYAIALACAFIEGLAVFANNSYYSFEGIAIFDLNFFDASLRYAMWFIVAFPFSFLSAWYITRFKVLREVLVFGLFMLLLFFILMATVTPSSPVDVLWGYPVFSGIAAGSLLTTIFVTAQLSISGELIAIGSGLVTAARSFGGLVGLVMNNAIFTSATQKNIPAKIAAAVLPLGLSPESLGSFIVALTSGNKEALAKIPHITPEIIGAGVAGLKQGYSVAFRNIWIASACITFPALVAACFLRNPKEQFNAHIDAPVEARLIEIQAEIEATETVDPARFESNREVKD